MSSPRPADRLRLSRISRGLSQESLAALAGVSRQAVSGFEAGRFSPSLEVALALATALSSTVEQLFGTAPALEPVPVRLADWPLPAGSPLRLLLAELGDEVVGFPLQGDRCLLPGFRSALASSEPISCEPRGAGRPAASRKPKAGTGARSDRRSVRARPLAAMTRTVAVAGCDPALALLEGPLRRHAPPLSLVWHPCGNAAARAMVEDAAVHAAAIHRAAGEPVRPAGGCTVVGFAAWREGLVLAPGLSGKVASMADVIEQRLRLVNREPGSEARRLLDTAIADCGASGADVEGYDSTCSAHLLVASAIAAGLGDVGVATEPAALAYGLGFVPWQEEICELHVPRALLGGSEVRGLLEVLAGSELRAQLAAIPGHDAAPLGQVREDG